MSADRLIEALCERNGFSRKPRLPPDPRIADQSVTWPSTFEIHDALLKGAISEASDICLLSPTLRHEYLEMFALSALFKQMGTDRERVLIVTTDTSVRERFRNLSPKHRRSWSKERFPIATVKQNGTLSQKTKSRADSGREPRTLFSRYLHYRPESEIAEEIGCVIYDGAVNYKPNRWKGFHEWRRKNCIPSVVYCLRDPLAPEYESVSDDVGIWAWPPGLIETVAESASDAVADGGGTGRFTRVQQQLDNKVKGIDREIHAITSGELIDRFNRVWEGIEELQDINRRLESDELDRAIHELKKALNILSNIVSSMGFTEKTYSEEWESLTPKNWFNRLDHYRKQLTSDETAKQAAGVFRSVCTELEEAYDTWETIDDSDTKKGHLYRLLYGSLDRGERTTVVVPKESDRKAVMLDLQQRGGDLYDALGTELLVVTPDTFAETRTSDRVIIAGPPRWRDRWILRTPHAPVVTILAYEHQLPLIGYQFDILNGALREVTDQPQFQQAIETAAGSHSPSASAVDQLDIEGPDVELGGESEIAEGYEVVEEHEPTSVDDIIDQMSAPGDIDTRSTPTDSTQTRKGSEPQQCLRLCFEDGRWMPVRRNHGLYVIDGDSGGVTKRAANRIHEGNTLVTIRQTQKLREQLYSLIKRRGDDRLIMQAELWKIKLQQEIEERNDSLDDFINRLQDAGADHGRGTFRRWYNLEVDYTREYEDMRRIAEAYDLTVVEEQLDSIWGAAQQVKQTYKKLLRELRNRAYQAAVGEEADEVVLSEEHDIKLSDIDTVDERGNNLVGRHTVVDVVEDEVPAHKLGDIRAE